MSDNKTLFDKVMRAAPFIGPSDPLVTVIELNGVIGGGPGRKGLSLAKLEKAIAAAFKPDKLAAVALSPEVRPRLLARTRRYVRRGYAVLETWLNEHGAIFTWTPPQAAAIAFVRYTLDIDSSAFVDRLRREQSVLVVPGAHAGIDYHLRISFGPPADYLQAGLDRISVFMETL